MPPGSRSFRRARPGRGGRGGRGRWQQQASPAEAEVQVQELKTASFVATSEVESAGELGVELKMEPKIESNGDVLVKEKIEHLQIQESSTPLIFNHALLPEEYLAKEPHLFEEQARDFWQVPEAAGDAGGEAIEVKVDLGAGRNAACGFLAGPEVDREEGVGVAESMGINPGAAGQQPVEEQIYDSKGEDICRVEEAKSCMKSGEVEEGAENSESDKADGEGGGEAAGRQEADKDTGGEDEANEFVTELSDQEGQNAMPISERRKHKRLEVFVGGLDKDATEEDLKLVFGQVGEVTEVRLMRDVRTGKNKGYAFIRYATAAQAKRAAHELERIEIRGRPCGVLPSEENDTLFLGNINKVWKKETVLEALAKYSVDGVEELTLMEDPQTEGVNRGFAFIEFANHKDALLAFRRLQQPHVSFGTDRSAKVAWAQPLNEPDEDVMSQVKSVFVDGMPPGWDEEHVKEHFGKFGEIERIVLARNMSSAKRKDFGFVNYAAREAALACIDALNNSEIVQGDLKMRVKVMLAKPQVKSKPVKGGIRGGYPLSRGDGRLAPRSGKGGSEGGRCESGRSGGRGGRSFSRGSSRGSPLSSGSGKKESEDDTSVGQLLRVLREQAAQDDKSVGAENAGGKPVLSSQVLTNSVVEGNLAAATEKLVMKGATEMSESGKLVDGCQKSSGDQFECTMCSFGSDVESDYSQHLKSRVHRVIEGLRKDEKLNNKTPLSLLHEYASRNHCEVQYDTKAGNSLGPFEVEATIGGGSSGVPLMKGDGKGRNKAKAKQMAAANALEKILDRVPESELTKPGQARQRFNERHSGSSNSSWASGGSKGGVAVGRGRGGFKQHRPQGSEKYGTPYVGTVSLFTAGNGNNLYPAHVDNGYMGDRGGGLNARSMGVSMNADYASRGLSRPGAHGLYADGYGSGGNYAESFPGGRGRVTGNGPGHPAHPETYAERLERVQGRGFAAANLRRVPVPAAYGRGAIGDYGEIIQYGVKRSYSALEEDARYLEGPHRAHLRARMETPDSVIMGGAPFLGFAEAVRTPVGRTAQYGAYPPQAIGPGLGGPVSLPGSMVGPIQQVPAFSVYEGPPQRPVGLVGGSLYPPSMHTYGVVYGSGPDYLGAAADMNARPTYQPAFGGLSQGPPVPGGYALPGTGQGPFY